MSSKIGSSRCRFLFQKHLSTSDCGVLGRVVLPRAAAEAFLPRLADGHRGGAGKGLPLRAVDARTGDSQSTTLRQGRDQARSLDLMSAMHAEVVVVGPKHA